MITSLQLSLALVISPGNIASSVTCPIWHQTWHPLVNVILCFEIPWNSQAVRFGGCIHECLKGFHCAWVPACVWGLRTGSIGYAEGGWRVVTSMRSIADLLVSRSCNETHWHRPVEGTFPPAASLSHLCPPIDANCSSTTSSDGTCGTGCRSHHQTTTSEQTDNSEDASPRNSRCLVTVCLSHQIQQQKQSQTEKNIRLCQTEENRQIWKSIQLCRRERNHGVL